MAYRQTSISENNYILRHTAKYHTRFIKFLLLEYLPELSRLARFDNIKIETSTERISVIYKYFIKALIILQNIFIKRSNSFPLLLFVFTFISGYYKPYLYFRHNLVPIHRHCIICIQFRDPVLQILLLLFHIMMFPDKSHYHHDQDDCCRQIPPAEAKRSMFQNV